MPRRDEANYRLEEFNWFRSVTTPPVEPQASAQIEEIQIETSTKMNTKRKMAAGWMKFNETSTCKVHSYDLIFK